MALVLGMNIEKDNEIYLNDLLVTIDQVISKAQAKVTVHGAYLDETFTLTNKDYTEVTKNVRMMLGLSSNKNGFCRVMVDAPQNIQVLRGALKEAQ